METECFDQIATNLAQAGSRRGIFRFLGAAALGAVGLSLATPEEGDAYGLLGGRRRRRRKNKGKKGKGKGKGNERCLKSGERCESDSQCCSKNNLICEVPQNASNSDTYCCGESGATCGGVNDDGDFLPPYCCIGEAGRRSFVCSESDPDNPFVKGTCIPAPDDEL